MLFGNQKDFLSVAVSIFCAAQCKDHTLWTSYATTVSYHNVK